jgi:hypothetical protein
MSRHAMGTLMKTFVIVTASIFGVASAAFAADLPVRQPVPPVAAAPAPLPVIGKMPIGKAPIGKWPVGKAPAVLAPPPPAPPIVTRG